MEEWNSCINTKHIFSPQLYLSPNLLLWNSHIRNCTKKGLFCRKITNSFFFFCFISPTYLKYHNWFMWSKASLSLLRHFSFITVFLLSFKGRHFNFRMRCGFESFFQTEAELGRGGVGSAIIPAVPHHSLMGLRCYTIHLQTFANPSSAFWVWAWQVSSERKKLPGSQVHSEGASSLWQQFGSTHRNLNWDSTVPITRMPCWSMNKLVSSWVSSDVTDLLDLWFNRKQE